MLGEPGAGKTTTVLELARDLIARARESAAESPPVVLALSTWRGQHKNLLDWLVAELGLRYQVPRRVATNWLEEGRLVLLLDGLDEVVPDRRAACVDAINAFAEAHPPAGLAVTCRVAEYDALATKLRLRSAICLQPLTPGQIDRYFKAAGASLEPLRAALREDAGLRELARSPLMLSVMTMAWRDAPADTRAPFAANRTPEELRHNLFDAYVQAALKRRGKATGQFAAEQTVAWLAWLAQRMKENGHTIFALEQLQPGWLDGAWRQLGYFLASRMLGTVGLALPSLVFQKLSGEGRLALAGLGAGVGAYIGVIDFAIARYGWGGHRRAALRLWAQLGGLLTMTIGLLIFAGSVDEAMGPYLVLVMLAFCAPVDVRGLDIKPTGSIQWAWRHALARGLTALACMNAAVVIGFVVNFCLTVGQDGWAKGWETMGDGLFWGLAVAAVAVGAAWARFRPRPTFQHLAWAVTLVIYGGQIGGVFGPPGWGWEKLLFQFMPATLLGVFSGFGSTLIDPARPQQAGPWFWLRVPVTAFLMVGFVMMIPVVMMVPMVRSDPSAGDLAQLAGTAGLVGGLSGLVAFLRFGGFNGAQHFLLRWLLARGGHLAPRPEAFLNHATQLALLQKVGLGYRFVHALLLQHLAVSGGRDTGRLPETAGTEMPGGTATWRGRTRLAASLGLMVAAGMFVWMIGMGSALHWTNVQYWNIPLVFFGTLMWSIALVIPLWLLSGRWLRASSGKALGGLYGLLALVTAYLAWDEQPVRPLTTTVQLAPVMPGTEKSYAVLKRFYGNQPASRAFKWPRLNFIETPQDDARWRQFLAEHRAEIEANWVALEPMRAWLDELNRFERIADLENNPLSWMGFNVMMRRVLLQNAMAVAALQALDGQGDAALSELLPLLEVGDKLETAARGKSVFETGRDLQGAALLGAAFVLDNARVSDSVRGRFAAALARGAHPEGVRRLFALRRAMLVAASRSPLQYDYYWRDPVTGAILDAVGWLEPVIFNRQATLNRWDRLLADLEELSLRRDFAGIERRWQEFAAAESRQRFKNIGGAWFSWSFQSRLNWEDRGKELAENYWKVEDRRAAVAEKLSGHGK
ncbi:MAG TPA: NACHT domain-containing protein [Gemmatimonadales bacterium]|nr:NACHT domain-containing protein [Gemmatimonadales bacterium]